MGRQITYDPKVYDFAVQWIDRAGINQSTNNYPDVTHRLAQTIQQALETFMTEEVQQ